MHLRSMSLSIENYAVIRAPGIRAAIRKVLRTGDTLTKMDANALLKLTQAPTAVFSSRRTAAVAENWPLQRDAATLFLHFHAWTSVDDLGGACAAPSGGVDGAQWGRAAPATLPLLPLP